MGYVKATLKLRQHAFVGRGANKGLTVHTYADADLAGDVQNARSTSGGLVRLQDEETESYMIIDFWSKRQTATAKSTTAAELVSLSYAADQHAVPAAMLLRAVLCRPIKCLYHEDNSAAIAVAKRGYSAAMRALAKHFRVAVSSLGELFHDADNDLLFCKSNDQKADPMTKGLSGPAMLLAQEHLDLARFCPDLDV